METPDSNRFAPSPAFWLAFEAVAGGAALPTTWMQHLDGELEVFKTLFLKSRPDEIADTVPCPWKCGCFHKVIPDTNGTLLGVCQCKNKACGTYTVLPYERIPLELDWSRLPRAISDAFGLTPRIVKLGMYNTLQIGAWSADAIPAILTLCSSRPELLNTIALLVARFGHPFILLAPTARHLGLAAKELLANTGAAFFALQNHLLLIHEERSSDSTPYTEDAQTTAGTPHPATHSLKLVCAVLPAKLFADVASLHPEPTDDDLARRTFIALQTQDTSRRRRPPSLYTVFQLYCVKDLTIPQIARKCRCSIGTVANRLQLLRAKIGVAPDQLRRVAPRFVRYEDDLRQAKRNLRPRYHSD